MEKILSIVILLVVGLLALSGCSSSFENQGNDNDISTNAVVVDGESSENVNTNLEHLNCISYCKNEGYKSGKCFDCVHLENVDLQTECTTNNFIYNDITWDICTEKKLKDNTQHGCLCE